MPSAPYRYRRCPECRATFPGGQLRPLRYGEGHWHSKGGSLRKCPNCSFVSFTQRFSLVGGVGRARYSGMN